MRHVQALKQQAKRRKRNTALAASGGDPSNSSPQRVSSAGGSGVNPGTPWGSQDPIGGSPGGSKNSDGPQETTPKLAGWQLSRKSTFSSNGDIEIHYTPRNTGFEPPPETESRMTRNAQADQTKLAEKIRQNDFHTMRDVLSSIAGFSISKLRKKLPKKAYLGKSAAIQLAHEGSIDLETPDSILGQINCRSLLNKATFLRLPPEYQFKLSKLLPTVDRSGSKVSHSSFNNEFFAKASQEWKERLLRGDFTGKAQAIVKDIACGIVQRLAEDHGSSSDQSSRLLVKFFDFCPNCRFKGLILVL